ncbi:MAG: hypothetical protein KGH59_01950 [Candidatus Micrarchaeota archaeon]|nr:hypothetical protein [Candidatus Micrarchaeota archaeon]MDE1804527.1 hypothetical protein [Candidatus Micrarchaeota archaeon]MDE1846968.1 hypothetical protein [Candidatus Micrarchaeota archaeon]
MPTKLSPEICYIAGMMNKTKQDERSAVGIRTTLDDVIEMFVEVALKLGVDTKKIVIEDVEGVRHVYFYNSKIAKHARELIGKETKVFRHRNQFAGSYLAGMFDAGGRKRGGRLSISGMTPSDRLMLDALGIRTRDSTIVNASAFLSLVKGHSALLG